jgi:circadian clock protein KaiC
MYITLSETQDEIRAVADSHGWSLDGLTIFELSALEQQLAQESQNTVFHPSEVELNETSKLLQQRIEEAKPSRLVIDSLSELRLLSDTPLRYRRQMLSLKQFFAGRKMTVMLLDDHAADGGDLHVQSIAHGVITLEQLESDYGAERRRLKVNKLRGVNFVGGFHDAIILPGGLRVFPRLVAAEHQVPFTEELLKSGVTNFDTIIGGGIDRGTSCLFLGPAGSGKSSLAMQFVIAAAERGENAQVYLFEENLRTLARRTKSLQMPLEEHVQNGRIVLQQIDPAQLAPGQFIQLVQTAVEQRKPSIILIDSLNGYLQAMPDVKFLNIQLHELLSFLAHHGVATLMTVAQHGMFGQMSSPVDLTYLADTVVLLRYFEQGGRVRKAISIIKKRVGAHEDTIRELRLAQNGITVGDALQNFAGVLTGVPRYTGSAEKMLPAE